MVTFLHRKNNYWKHTNYLMHLYRLMLKHAYIYNIHIYHINKRGLQLYNDSAFLFCEKRLDVYLFDL